MNSVLPNGLRRLLVVALFALGLFGSSSAWAGGAGVGTGHGGFWYRTNAGLGYSRAAATQGGVDILANGFGLTAGGQIGWAVNERMVLHLNLDATYVFNPKVTATATGTDGAQYSISQDSKGNLIPILFGPGATYYVSSAGVLSGALGLTGLELGSLNTHPGVGLNLMAGFEGEPRGRRFIGGAVKLSISANSSTTADGANPVVWTSTIALVLNAGGG